MPNLDEIKARRDLLNTHVDRNIYQYQKDIVVFHENAPTDIDWLVQEVERLKAEKAQAEAERDVLLHELLKETHSHLCEDPERPCPFDEETEGEYCSNECANADPETCWRKYAQQQARSVGDARP